MKKEDKIFLVVFATMMLVGTACLLYITEPYEEIVWIPQNATLVNIVGNEFIPIQDVKISGTAIEILLRDYQKKFTDTENAVYVQHDFFNPDRFTVYYVTRQKDKTYYSQYRHNAYSGDYKFLYKEGVLKTYYQRNWNFVFLMFMLLILSLMIALKASGRQ